MPRLYFHTKHVDAHQDQEGTDFPDIGKARRHAVSFTGDFVRGLGEAIYERGASITVTDEVGLLMWDFIIVATEGAAARR